MKLWINLFFLFITLSSFAQDSVTIVAVGEAEQEEEKMAFLTPKFEGTINAREQKEVNDMLKVFIDDFDFYRHLFEVSQKLIPREIVPNYEQWKKKNYRYIVESIIFNEKKSLHIELKLYDVQAKNILLDDKTIFDSKNLRKYSHNLANRMYRRITGKDSIFNSKIVFVSDRSSKRHKSQKEIYIMDFDGQRKQRLTYSNSMIISPSISPDNTKILYSIIEGKWKKSSRGSIHKVKNINLYLYDLVTHKKKLISELDGINSGAIFTHDGKSIYLTLSYQKNADIFKMDLATGRKTRVTRHFADDVDPHINAAGDLMTFLSGRSGRAMIYTLDPREIEKSVKRISYVGRFNAAPRFSPDGKEIVFSSWVDDRFDLYKIDSNGNNLVRLTKNFGSNEEPWFSPDGQFIVFSSQRVLSRKKAVQNLYIMNREGEIIKKITDNFGKSYTPRWSN